MHNDFYDYLMTKCDTKDVEHQEKWLERLDIEDFINYGNEFARIYHRQEIDKIIK